MAKVTVIELEGCMSGHKIYKKHSEITLEKTGCHTIQLSTQQWVQLFNDIERLKEGTDAQTSS